MENKYYEAFVKLGRNIEFKIASIKISENIPHIGHDLGNKLVFGFNDGNYNVTLNNVMLNYLNKPLNLGIVSFINNKLKYLNQERSELILKEISEKDFITFGLESILENLFDEIFVEVE